MRPFLYSAPTTLEEVIGALGPDVRPLAGGTDLVTLMNADLAEPSRLLAVRTLLPSAIEATDHGITIGAGVTLSAIERAPALIDRYTALAQAAGSAASQQIRNMATIGGNLLQRPRCWYFRNPLIACWLKGGDTCPARDGENQRHALFGDSPCVAVHPSDPAAALLAFGAEVRLRGRHGERRLPLDQLLVLPDAGRRTETTVREDELILDIHLPSPRAGSRSVYLKAMDRGAFSFALVGVAVVAHRGEGHRIDSARIVLAGVAPVPWRCEPAESLLQSRRVDDDLVRATAEAALADAKPLQHNAWKIPLARTLLTRALQATVLDGLTRR